MLAGMQVDLGPGRDALVASVGAFADTVGDLDELQLLAGSRCHGWTRLDVVSHLLGGWQELLGGFACATHARADVDAASYWTSWSAEHADLDPVEPLMWQRRRTAVYRRPAHAVAELRDVAEVLVKATAALDDRARAFQGHVLTPGDLCATWAVETAVHHLDLLVDPPPAAAGTRLARQTVEAILGAPLPASWSDVDAVLVGAGRVPAPPDLDPTLAAALPALG